MLAAATVPTARLSVTVQRRDYLAAALAAKVEGEVPVTLHVGVDGTLRCSVDDRAAPDAVRGHKERNISMGST